MSDHQDIYSMEAPVQEPPRRVVSLVPSLTESLFDLDLGDRLVAVTNYCVYPKSGVTNLLKVGGTKTPNVAAIIELQPDVVMMNQEENRKEDAVALRDAGIPVWATHPTSVQDAINVLWDIMNVFDHPTMVERVRWIERQLDWTTAATKSQPPVKVFVPIWYDPWITIRRNTYMHDLLRVCGAENVFAGSHTLVSADGGYQSPYPTIALEQVEAVQPEVVLLPDEPFPFDSVHAAEIASLDIPAAHNGRIHHVEGTLLSWHGTRLAYALNDLPPLLALTDEIARD